ncbi:fruiting body protein SC1 [Schizophyllum fasciatum]
MRFALALLALPLLASAGAVPSGKPHGGKGGAEAGKCNSGPVQCCNEVYDIANTDHHDAISGLLGLDLGGLSGLIAARCSPLSVVGIGGGCQASATAVCCKDVSQNGLVNLGCDAVDVKA